MIEWFSQQTLSVVSPEMFLPASISALFATNCLLALKPMKSTLVQHHSKGASKIMLWLHDYFAFSVDNDRTRCREYSRLASGTSWLENELSICSSLLRIDLKQTCANKAAGTKRMDS